MNNRYKKKIAEMKEILGNKCAVCGATDKSLDFDHINPKSKSFTICDEWSKNGDDLQNELVKCQLLCVDCHNDKTLKQKSFQKVKEQNLHGTLSCYRYCKCDICRKAKADYMREYGKKRRAKL